MEDKGSRPTGVSFEKFKLCRRSSIFVNNKFDSYHLKSSIFIVKFSSGMSETFFDTCVNWSCVTRCGCRTTSSTVFTVKEIAAYRRVNGMIGIKYLTITLPPLITTRRHVFTDDIIVILLLGYFLYAGKLYSSRYMFSKKSGAYKFHTYCGRKKNCPEFAIELSS